MEYGIQRGSIYLVPPSGEDLEWVLDCYDQAAIYKMFGMDGPSRAVIEARHRAGELVMGVTHRTRDEARVGFVTVFPPSPLLNGWEVGQAIPDPAHRNAGHAQDVGDAIGHYMFDHLHIEQIGLRIRADNPASIRVVERLGYQRYGTWGRKGVDYHYYTITPALWSKRVEALQAKRPDQDVFVMLEGPNYRPVSD